MSSQYSPKVIAVIGATGAQGMAVIRALLGPSNDGSPSPWKVRALTRNPEHRRAKELRDLGAEIFEGSFLDFPSVERLFSGAYGAFVNTDGFTCGEAAETHAGIVIYELSRVHRVRHFVYSGLDNVFKTSGWDPKYKVDHYVGKSRVVEYLRSQPNELDQSGGGIWSVINTGPYMDMLTIMFAPVKERENGTKVFISPLGNDGHVPFVTLTDIAWWARHTFDNPKDMTGKLLEIASQLVSSPELVETFTRVTGIPAEFKPLSLDEYFGLFLKGNKPIASDLDNGTTVEQNFRAWFTMFKDNMIQRDLKWVRSIHPDTVTLEQWMREKNYKGEKFVNLLKNSEDGKGMLEWNAEKIANL